MLVRAPQTRVVRRRVNTPVRFAHGHGEYHHLPFQFPGNKRASFGLKLSAFLLTGFSIPFLAAAFQLKKAGAV
ncbi:hypothetical protein EDD17DRAFT_1557938 [Pisolithus thermaeus]|nr:hypothetical protein EDD17DRAFT_1557938 [Pisolithus thermaeus]